MSDARTSRSILLNNCLLQRRLNWWWWCIDGTLLAKVGEPCTVVKLSVVLLDQTLVVDDHVVHTSDGQCAREGQEAPSPRDGLAVMEYVEGGNCDFRLEDTLTIVEGSLIGEGDGAEL